MNAKRIAKKVLKHVVGIAIITVVALACVVACVAIHGHFKTKATTQVAAGQAAAERAKSDGTTHGLTIVWPSGKEESFQYSETITPKHSEYHGPINEHYTLIDMISFNPLDSANKAIENLKPSVFAEGEKPALQLDEDGVDASKAKGAVATGESGSDPNLGEYTGWVFIAVIGIIGLLIATGVGKWLLAEWKKIEPTVVAAAEKAVGVQTTSETKTS